MKLYKHATALTLTKLAYLTDLHVHAKTGQRLSGFAYRLLSFGLFDPGIYIALEKLISRNVIRSCLNYTNTGLEYVSYAFNDAIGDLNFKRKYLPDVTLVEFRLIRDIVCEFFNYSELRLTKMIYHSRPVRALGVFSPKDPGACGQPLDFKNDYNLLK
jgi:hypothetical protein